MSPVFPNSASQNAGRSTPQPPQPGMLRSGIKTNQLGGLRKQLQHYDVLQVPQKELSERGNMGFLPAERHTHLGTSGLPQHRQVSPAT